MGVIKKVVGKITGADDAAKAASKAAKVQAASAAAGINATQEQFDKTVELMKPFVEMGSKAVGAQGDLVGLGEPEALQAAINNIRDSAEYQALANAQETAMLQAGSATGGLRGGNMQEALADNRAMLLSDMINQRFNRLGGLTQVGQAGAAMQASAGQAAAQNIANLHGQHGAALAGGIIGKGNEGRMVWGDIMNMGRLAADFKRAF